MFPKLRQIVKNQLQEIAVKPRQLLYISLMIAVYMVYCLSRTLHDPNFVVGWFAGIYFALVSIHSRRTVAFCRKHYKSILLVGATTVILYSYLYYRTNSWDGSALYFRNVYLVAEKGHSAVLQGALWPYLSELFLGLVAKFTSYRFMFMFFGVAAVANLFLLYRLYRKLNLSSFVTKYSLLIFASSPTFIMLTAHEFKVELFLLVFTVLFAFILIDTRLRPNSRLYFVLGFVGAIASLIKISALPLVLFAPALLLLVTALNKGQPFMWDIKHTACFLAGFMLPFCLWLLYSSTNIPFIGVVDIRHRADNPEFKDLDRNPTVLAECNRQKSSRDLKSWIYFDNGLFLLVQPFQYLSLIGANPDKFIFNTGNPGLCIYLGVWLLPLAVFAVYKKHNSLMVFFYLSILPFVFVIYLLTKGVVFWYLLPVFPFLATVAPILAERYFRGRLAFYVFRMIVLSLFFMHALFGLSVAISFLSSQKAKSIQESDPVTYELSKKADYFSNTGLILDATQHLHITFLPYMDNYGTKLVRSDYYFASSGKTVEEMRSELIAKGIKYIIARKANLFDNWYIGCPLYNNVLLNQFLEKYTTIVYDSGYIGEIYEII